MYNLKIEITGKSLDWLIDELKALQDQLKNGEAKGSFERDNVISNYTIDRDNKETFDNEIEEDTINYKVRETYNNKIISILRLPDNDTFYLFQKTKTGTIIEFVESDAWGGGLCVKFKEGHNTSINMIVA